MPSRSVPNSLAVSQFRWRGILLLAFIIVGLWAVAPAPSTASQAVTSQPIVGGADADPGEWPWQVALVYTDGGSDWDNHFCGGSLIDPQWVVTAAHCLIEENGDPSTLASFKIIIGRTSLTSDNGETISPMEIFIHPDYALNEDPDVALIKLATPSSGTPISLARDPSAPYLAAGQVAIATGWGSTVGYEPGNEEPDIGYLPTLQEVSEILRTDADCAAWYNPGYVNSTMLCAGGDPEGGTGTCQGDSGGPLVVFDEAGQSWMLAGITSFGDGCAAANVPNVYTEVAGVLAFIEGHTGPLHPDTSPRAFFPLLTRD